MQSKFKKLAAVAGATLAVTGVMAINNANAAPNNGSMTGVGNLRLCVGEGRGYVVADGPTMIQTQVLSAGGCDNYTGIPVGTYYIKADKYIDAPCFTETPRVRDALDPQGRCHAKVHHAHTSRYPGAPVAETPTGAPFTTIEVPDYVIVNVASTQTTLVSLHVVDEDYPECLQSSANTQSTPRSCNAHPVTGPNHGI